MNIAVISDLWANFPGGAERYVQNVSAALIKRGHQCHVLTSYAPAVPKNCTTLTIADIGVNDRIGQGRKLIQEWLEAQNPDLILTHHYFVGVFGDLFASQPVPFVEIIHNRPRHSDATFAIFNSRYTATRAGYKDGDMIMLPPADESCVASEHGNAILMIKPLEGKGIRLVYDLANEFPDRKFVILRGEWQDCEYIERHHNIEFLEPVNDIRDFWKRGRILLMPSLSEDAGTSCQEAALNGIPALSSNVGGLPETNRGGIILPVGSGTDYITWKNAITDLDNPIYYNMVINRQLQSLPEWDLQFDEIDRKIRAL